MPLGIDLLQVLLHAFNVVILFGGMYILLYSPVKKFMDKREEYYAGLDKQAKDRLSEADGLKACDSLERRTMLRTHGPMREDSLKCSVIWDWGAQEVRDYLDSFGIKGPPDYAMFGTSFDGLSSRFTREIKKRYPEDYEIIKAWFPLIDLDMEREDTYGV